VRPVRFVLKEPVPVPFAVVEFEVVGHGRVP
jgi:hypothetical protein